MPDALTKAGRYQILSELGRGSMGVVYHGFDPVIGRTVAIKTMLTEGLTSQEFQEFKARFQREAQAAGVLSHPNIVNVFDYGEDNGILYLIMEYLEGKSLEKLVEEQGILPIETIIPMYDQVCSALDHAHQHNVVHRDIKPANIMILDTGMVKVTDFGIAKMMSMGMTQAGQVLGTPNYMSPEQVKGRQIDGRSDIFSLGIILYDLVTGEMPFGGENITTVIYKIINENPIPPRELDATIHPGLSYVICKALAKSPDERYQTCRELADDLKNFKCLAGLASPSATIVVKVPPLPSTDLERAAAPPVEISRPPAAPTEAVQTTPIERFSPGQAPAQVMPPTTFQKLHTPPMIWILLTLGAVVFLGILGGGGYLLFKGKSQVANSQAGQIAQPVNPSVQNPGANPPVTPATQAPEITTQTPQEGPAAGKEKPAKKEVEAPSTIPVPRGVGGRPSATSKIGQLRVESNVPGATISVDGQIKPNCVTPCTISGLSASTHQVVVSKEGYDDSSQPVTIEGGKTSMVNAHLSVGSGELQVVTKPPGLEVLIDGKSIGLSPAQAPVPAGKHTYRILRPGAEPYENTVPVESGQVKRVMFTIPGGSVGPPTEIVTVRSMPPGATVSVDGNAPVGQTPTSFPLTAGQHKLIISLSGRSVERMIDVKIGEQPAEVHVDMRKQ
jgi:serine/threonine-protein kinase